jgi:hypothetical protein
LFGLIVERQIAVMAELDANLADDRIAAGLRVPFTSHVVTATI